MRESFHRSLALLRPDIFRELAAMLRQTVNLKRVTVYQLAPCRNHWFESLRAWCVVGGQVMRKQIPPNECSYRQLPYSSTDSMPLREPTFVDINHLQVSSGTKRSYHRQPCTEISGRVPFSATVPSIQTHALRG